MKRKVLIIILALILLLAAAAAGYFFFFRDKGETEEQTAVNVEYAIEASFVTNVKDSSKLFKTTVVLVADKNGLDQFFNEKQYIIRDEILFLLRDLTENDLRSEDIQEQLRRSIPVALNEVLEIDSIISIYFTDFVMQ